MTQEYDKCFVCGKDNPIGLKLDFHFEEGIARAEVTLSELFEGYPGVIHGGIVCTLLDEAMAKALLHKGVVAFTARLNTSYRNPVPANAQLSLKGWITEQKSRTIRCQAELFDLTCVYAEAEAVFIAPGARA